MNGTVLNALALNGTALNTAVLNALALNTAVLNGAMLNGSIFVAGPPPDPGFGPTFFLVDFEPLIVSAAPEVDHLDAEPL